MTSPSQEDRDELLRAAVAAPSLHNSQPWKFRFRGSVVEVHRDRERELPAEDPNGRMLFLSLGATILNLRVGAAQLGFGAAARNVLDRRRPDLVAEVDLLPPGQEMEKLRVLAPSVQERRSNRGPYTEERLPDELCRLLDLTATLERAELTWLDAPARLKWLRLTTNDAGSAFDEVAPGAGAEQDPQLAVLTTRYDGPVEWLRAGQAMQRVLLVATAHGVATSVLNQAIVHDALRWLVNDPLGTWHRPQAVIRFGYGPLVPPTPRRPLNAFLLD
jgi:nitroreductase